MLNDTIEKIAKSIRESGGLNEAQKKELEGMISQLKSELSGLYGANKADAESIINFVASSAHEAAKEGGSDLAGLSREGLLKSVRKYEASHPALFSVVNSICDYLAGIGI